MHTFYCTISHYATHAYRLSQCMCFQTNIYAQIDWNFSSIHLNWGIIMQWIKFKTVIIKYLNENVGILFDLNNMLTRTTHRNWLQEVQSHWNERKKIIWIVMLTKKVNLWFVNFRKLLVGVAHALIWEWP